MTTLPSALDTLGLYGKTYTHDGDHRSLLHRRAAEERMARSVDAFYGDKRPPLPIGVRPARADDRTDAAT